MSSRGSRSSLTWNKHSRQSQLIFTFLLFFLPFYFFHSFGILFEGNEAPGESQYIFLSVPFRRRFLAFRLGNSSTRHRLTSRDGLTEGSRKGQSGSLRRREKKTIWPVVRLLMSSGVSEHFFRIVLTCVCGRRVPNTIYQQYRVVTRNINFFIFPLFKGMANARQ